MMSSTLAMVLMAAMAVPGNGPEEKVSAEAEQRLDLRGEWKGMYQSPRGKYAPASSITIAGFGGVFSRFIVVHWPDGIGELRLRINRSLLIDEGGGRLRIMGIVNDRCGVTVLGIYDQQEGRVILCLRPRKNGYPTSFRGGDGQELYILHRVKPGK